MKLTDIKRTMQVFAVKVSIAHEKSVAEMIDSKLPTRDPRPDVKSILVLDQLRGYIFVEAPHQRDVMLACSDIRHVKGKALGQIKLEELDHFLKPEPLTDTLMVGDKVEIIAGLFAGEKAYVSRIDEAKEEVTLSLVGSDNPIPIKVHADYLKVIESGAIQHTFEGEATVMGRGIKEYTIGDTKDKEASEIETFGDDFPKEELEGEAPEIIIHTGKKQKVVGELFDLLSDDDDEEFDDSFSDEYLVDEGSDAADKEDQSGEAGEHDEDEDDDDW